MNEVASTNVKPNPWYKWERFPLVPLLTFKKGDEWNSTKIYLRWLSIGIGDAMSPKFGFEFNAEAYGIGARISLPYIHIWITILPLPYQLDQWCHRYLWRVGARSKFKWQR